ncbi:hypothetical protein GIB67_018050 [Kingdonia uniflora]|uniref:Pentatricopeptide repeat-containing protein n=1 Tax=Kingdonia uniflora TaxID=39325 RepID=A0A7J7NA14_9MAGN|nr:hypothetical protein GIB67_027855 [Kingdonia uniflora]KAF6171526.1 hypothetical protein GIB67_018050 [Kingdonia uniflora]
MGLFNNAIQMRPSPSILLFTVLLGAICKLRQYSTVITMFKAMDSKGIKANTVTFATLINCFCQMGKVDFGLAVVENIFKSTYEPHIFTTLLKGLFKENRVKDAIQLFNKITENGYASVLSPARSSAWVREEFQEYLYLKYPSSLGYTV